MLYLYFTNPLNLTWHYNNAWLLAPLVAGYFHFEWIWGLQYYVNRLSLLRGGSVLKVEVSNMVNSRYITWIYINEINLLTECKTKLEPEKGLDAEPVDEEQCVMKYEAQIQVDHYTFQGRNHDDTILTFMKEGKVTRPDILNAVLRGFEVDTSNFRINTRNVERWFEPRGSDTAIDPVNNIKKIFHMH